MSTTITAIYGARKAAGLDDDTARDVYERVTGERSLRAMSPRQQVLVLQELRRSAGRPAPGAMTGPYAGKLQALWISGYNLGVVRDRRDTALLAFVSRQTGIEAVRFLRDAADARRAVEALKNWLAREASVDWSSLADIDAVIAAQGKLLELGADEQGRDAAAFAAWRRDDLSPDEKIAVSQQLGQSIRRRS